MFVVYFNPQDFPGKYVVRRHVVGRGTVTIDAEPLIVCDSLHQARSAIPADTRLDRNPDDDPVIVEVWL